jgi:hypothetical protein
LSEGNTVEPSIKPPEKLLQNNPCLICFGNQNSVTQEILLAEFGATKLWDSFDRHQREGHEEAVQD